MPIASRKARAEPSGLTYGDQWKHEVASPGRAPIRARLARAEWRSAAALRPAANAPARCWIQLAAVRRTARRHEPRRTAAANAQAGSGHATESAAMTTVAAVGFLGPNRLVYACAADHGGTVVTLAEPILVPDGERFKQLSTVSRIYDALIRQREHLHAVLAIGDVELDRLLPSHGVLQGE